MWYKTWYYDPLCVIRTLHLHSSNKSQLLIVHNWHEEISNKNIFSYIIIILEESQWYLMAIYITKNLLTMLFWEYRIKMSCNVHTENLQCFKQVEYYRVLFNLGNRIEKNSYKIKLLTKGGRKNIGPAFWAGQWPSLVCNAARWCAPLLTVVVSFSYVMSSPSSIFTPHILCLNLFSLKINSIWWLNNIHEEKKFEDIWGKKFTCEVILFSHNCIGMYIDTKSIRYDD